MTEGVVVAVSAQSFAVSGVATVVAGAITLTPSLTPPVARMATPSAIQLVAAVQPVDLDLVAPAGQQLVPAVADVASASPVADAVTSIGDAIENLYNAVEPWVRYGFELTTWALGWFIGILAPQIMYFYNLGEPIIQSLLFNTIDFLDGAISFSQATSNIYVDTTDTIHTFIHTEISWIRSLFPPYPPIGHSLTLPALPEPATVVADAHIAAAALPDFVDSGVLTDHLGALSDLAAVFDVGALSTIGAEIGNAALSLIP